MRPGYDMMTDGVFPRQGDDNKHIISQLISPHTVPYPPSCWMIYKKDFAGDVRLLHYYIDKYYYVEGEL